MSAPIARLLGRRLPAGVMHAIDVPMRRVLDLPMSTLVSGQIMLVRLTGRRTGRSYWQPVSYVRDGSALLSAGGGRWKLNPPDGRPVRLRLGGRVVTARAELVADVDEVGRLLEVMIHVDAGVTTFARVRRRGDGHLDRVSVERAVGRGLRIVRWHLDDPGILDA